MPFPFRCALVLLAGWLTGALVFAAPPEKTIHLRNERIATPAKSSPAAKAAPAELPPGLRLIQFEAPPTPEQRAALSALGVALLAYVPDDAFVADTGEVMPAQLRALPFVRWVGSYRAEHKLDTRLAPRATARGATADVEIRALLAPGARPDRVLAARGLFNGAPEQTTLRFGSLLRGRIPAARLNALAESPAVLWIEPAPSMKLNDAISTKIVAGDDGVATNLAVMHQLGFTGAGVTVAVADSGLDSGEIDFMHPDIAGRVAALFAYGNPPDAADEHSHGTHVAGIIAGNGATGERDENGYLYGLGVAPGARLVGQRLFDGAGNYTYPHASFAPLTRDATQAGAEIGSNSWGEDTQGRYDLSAMEFDALVRDADPTRPGDQPYILEFSAGNAGPGEQTIGSPAVAKNVIATGASQNDRLDFLIYADGSEAMADFSSRGPCEDGRIKPDVVAPGTWIASLRSVYADDNNAWGPISSYYLYQGGTSQAGPQVSGAAAIWVQYYRSNFAGLTPSPALTKAALIHSAVDLDDDSGTEPVPNPEEGWGRVDLTEIIGSPRDFDFVDQTVTLTNGAVFERRLVFADPDEPLKVTLSYTDEPGLPAALPALVNDLDLEVVAPNGAVYRGNQFLNGESVANTPGPDAINNVEGVFLARPLPGEYIVRVRARRVAQDARRDTPAVDQDFALVTSGALLPAGRGLIYLNRGRFTAPGVMRVTVIDSDQAGQPTVNATVASTLQPTPLPVTLAADGNTGVFTGSVATATAPVLSNGKLHLAHGNTITAAYFDASAGVTRTATAVADLAPPVITAVRATNEFGSTFVSWSTDEPADSVVFFGTNAPPSRAATNAPLATAHRVRLDNLVPERTYLYAVSSADEAGNRATNNNAGAFFSFVAATPLPVLLVNAYAPFASDPSPLIPLSEYTTPLAQTGIPFEVWNVNALGLPSPATLRNFRVVIWRVNDSLWGGLVGYPGLSAAERGLLTGYVTNGGGLCLASMELLSRMGTGGDAMAFRQNVLRVAAFNEDNGTLGVDGAIGYDADPISAGMGLLLDYDNYADDFWGLIGVSPNVSDTLTPATNAAPVFFDAGSGRPCGVRFPRTGEDSVGRVVFLSFPLDAVPLTGDPPDTRANLLRNIISFLAPGLNGIGSIALNNSAYSIPALVTVEVADSDLAGQGTATVTVASDTQTNAVPVTLAETVLPGLFRGTVALVAATNAAGPGRLRAAHGDTLRAEYFDASGNSLIFAQAEVDTRPPALTNLAAAPAYQECEITWDTSEDTDALVQFWEGTPPFSINRTAYAPGPNSRHAVRLTALKPDTLYTYQVVSRDSAGNTTTDNNNGAYHTFRTLQPLAPPFLDTLETAATRTNWSVISSEYSETGWTLGPPNNGDATNAVSPVNVWGSSRNGDFVSAIETYLVAPALLLPTNGTPWLRFWHSYDFTERAEFDLLEFGQLSIATNSAGPLIPLLALSDDFSLGWEEIAIDLTPYRGQVIYLVWTHFLFSLESAARPGWLLDDISVTVSNAATGTLVVTNNLWQAAFLLDGTPRAGRTFTDPAAASGAHTIVFQPVPFYQTPPPQTNTLTAGGTLTFTGNYTFTDANHNGIADAWELARFGEVSPARTATTDTDGDGMSDYAEFIAGTNPNDPLPPFRFTSITASNGALHASWNTAPGWSYRLLAATNFANWSPLTGWLPATGTNLSHAAPPAAPAQLWRAEATNTSGLPADLRLTATPLGSNALRFDWTSVGTRAYRLHSSSNLLHWTPVSAWLPTNTFTLTPLPAAPRHFRLEVAP